MVACSIEGCEKPSRKRGWCEMHYSRFKVHGTPHVPGRREQADECQQDGCSEKPIAKDMCRRHYYATKRAAMRAALPPPPPPPPRPKCTVAGCDETVVSRQLCGAHYQRWRRFGDATYYPPAIENVCTVEGCDNPRNARGLCSSHYYRWSRYGDPLISKNRPRVTSPTYYPERECVTCGLTFDPGRSSVRKYCSRACRPTRANHGVNTRATVVRLGADRGWVCTLCHTDVDPTRFWPDPDAGSVDHIIPVKWGGNDDWANLQLAHLSCNLAKGARQAT